MTKTTKIPANALFNANLWACSPKGLEKALNEHLREYHKFDPNVFLELYIELTRGESSYGLKVNLCKIAQVMKICSKCNLANTEHCHLLVPAVATEKSSNAEILLGITEGLVETFNFSDVPYVWVPIKKKLIVLPVLSKKFEYWLGGYFYREQRKPIASEAIASALNTFCSKALFESPTYELFNRAAFHDGCIWVDLSNEEGESVRIGPSGWDIVKRTPVPIFRSYSHQLPMYTPQRHDSVEPDDLRKRLEKVLDYINISKENRSQRLLLMVHLVSFFIPGIPRSAVNLHGVQGSAKTSAAIVFKRLIDKAKPEVQSLAKSKEELIQALDHHYLLVLDNLTKIYDSQSDLFCGAITGTGTQTRKLYSDDDVFLRFFKRCLIFTGINVTPKNPDLLDRCSSYELEKMSSETRREEIPFWIDFEENAPFILGTIFDILSSAMSIKDEIKTTGLPRMADWASWCCAITRAIGINDNDWLSAYEINRRALNDHALLSDNVGFLLVRLLEREQQWSGIAGDLLATLEKEAGDANVSIKKDWPPDPPRLGTRLKSLEVNLGDFGIDFQRDTKRTARKLYFKYTRKVDGIKSCLLYTSPSPRD